MKIRYLQTGCGGLHVIVGFDPDDGTLKTTYFNKGSTGGCHNFMTGLSRTVSMLGRAGVSVDDIVDQLDSTGACSSYAARQAKKGDTSKGACCPMAIGNAIKDMHKEVLAEIESGGVRKPKACSVSPASKNCAECEDPMADIVTQKKCPECGEPVGFEGGCVICRNCSWSGCG